MYQIPTSGAVFAAYGTIDSDNYLVLGFDFGTGSTFRVGGNRADVRDATGIAWTVNPGQGAPVRVEQDTRFLDEMVLSAIPQAILRRVTSNPELLVSKHTNDAGDTEFVFQGMPPRVLGQPENGNLSLIVDQSGRVTTAKYGENQVSFSYAATADLIGSPNGIHVASLFAEQPTYALTSVKYSDSIVDPVQSARQLLGQRTAAKLQTARPSNTSAAQVAQTGSAGHSSENRVVERSPEVSATTPREQRLPVSPSPESSVSWPFIVTGIVLALLVIYVRTRRAA